MYDNWNPLSVLQWGPTPHIPFSNFTVHLYQVSAHYAALPLMAAARMFPRTLILCEHDLTDSSLMDACVISHCSVFHTTVGSILANVFLLARAITPFRYSSRSENLGPMRRHI